MSVEPSNIRTSVTPPGCQRLSPSKPAGPGEAEVARARANEILESIGDAFVSLDSRWCYTQVNERAAQIFGRRREELLGKNIWTEFPEAVGQPAYQACHQAMTGQRFVFLEEYHPSLDRWFEKRIHPVPDGLAIFFHDITARKRAEALFTGQIQVLELIATGAVLAESLTALLRIIEAQSADMLCSILLLDADGVHVRHGAAPSLPEKFIRAIDGQPIGPDAGSCGTAAFRREPVIVADIATDPLWAAYRDAALPHGLRACWSTPVFDAQRQVIGTFAIYYRQPGLPQPSHLRLIEIATGMAAICISHHRAKEALRDSEARIRNVFEQASDGIYIISAENRYLDANARGLELLGYTRDELLRLGVKDVLAPHEAARLAVEPPQMMSGVPHLAEWDHLRKNGSRFRGEVSARRINPHSYLAIVRDLTGRRQSEAAMRESEERLRLALDAAHMGTFDWDPPRNRITWSRWHEELWGFKPGEFSGTYEAFAQRLHPDDLPGVNAEVARCIAARAPFSREFRVVWADGSVHWIVGVGEFTFDGTGQPVRMRGAVVETTERRRAEEALRASELHHRLMAEIIAGFAFAYRVHPDRSVQLEWASSSMAQVIGYSEAELMAGRSFRSLIHPEDRASQQAALERVLAGHPEIMEFRVTTKAGETRWLECFNRPEWSETEHRVVRICGASQDITARKQAEAEVRQSQKRLRNLIDGLGPSMFVGLMTTDGVLLEANRPALAAAGLKPEDVLGKPCEETYWWTYCPKVQQQLRDAIVRAARGEASRYDVEVRVAENQFVSLDFSLEPLRDETGKIVFLVPSGSVITERKLAEQKLRESREQLRALLTRLQKAQEEERIRVAREIHDELGQLLTGLKMDVRWLERKLADPGLPPALHPLLDRAVGASELADQTIAVVQKIAAELRPGALDRLGLGAALKQRARRFQERTGIHCQVVVTESGPALPAETASELFYICQEALTNVTRHAQATEVEIRFETSAAGSVLEVCDNGGGIAEADFHAPQSLGLLGMRERVSHCGGSIVWQRCEPQGTRVTVRIPPGGANLKSEEAS